MKFDKDWIDALLAQVDIVEIIGQRIELKQAAGGEYKACCPFHDEKTPSFTVSQAKQFYHCFGCQCSGDAISFIREYEAIGFQDAVKELAGAIGMELPDNGREGQRRLEGNVSSALAMASERYRICLGKNKRALDFLNKCGIDEEQIQQFGFGYVDADYHGSLARDVGNKILLQSGLARQSGNIYKSWAMDRITLCIRSGRGSAVGFIGQGMDQLRSVCSVEQPLMQGVLFGAYEARRSVKKTNTLVLVEKAIDVPALHARGVKCCAAMAHREISQALLEKHYAQCENIVFCFAAARVKEPVFVQAVQAGLSTLVEGRDCAFAILPSKYRHCTSFIEDQGVEAFHQLIESAPGVVDTIYRTMRGTKKHKDVGETLKGIRTEALKALSTIPSALYRRVAIQRLDELLESK